MKIGFKASLVGIKIAALGAAIVLGIGSAYQGLGSIGNKTVEDNVLWRTPGLASDESGLPYTLGRYLTKGQLPPPLSVQDFVRSVDDDQKRLDGSCAIELTGAVPAARWWTVSAVNSDGVAFSDSNTLTAGAAVLEADGKLILHVASSPQPGNWIKPPSSGNYSIALTLHDVVDDRGGPLKLPSIKQVSC